MSLRSFHETADPLTDMPPVSKAPLVSVVVVTYQSAQHLPDLLHSLRAQTLRDFEVVHVDSASADGTCATLDHHWPDLSRIWSSENLGYRRGNQRGMEMAAGKYILLVNDDVELHPRLLEELVATAEADERIAIVAPAILVHGYSRRLNAAGSALMPAGFYSARGKDQPYEDFREAADLVAASGCCFLLRRSFFQRSGGFAPIFDALPSGWHASAEDLDLCWRAWAGGWRVRYQPRAVLWHKYTQKQLDKARLASLLSGRMVFVWMNFSKGMLWRLAPVLLVTECAVAAYCAVRGARFLRAWGTCWNWAWRSRRRLGELRKVRLSQKRRPDRELLTLLSPAITLAPELQRNWIVRAACWTWFGWNALWLGWRSSPVHSARIYPAVKRLADTATAAVLIVLLAPLLAVLATMVRWKLGSPVLFRQTRIGWQEQPFLLYKFRSMRDAQDSNGKPLPDAERLTRFGGWLRSWSLDELPQLWNVLRGDMSFIGPRPLLPQYLPRYTEHHRIRHQVKPGLSGLAQVNGRNAITWQSRLDLDAEYVRSISPLLDLSIAWRTLGKLIRRDGISRAGAATMPEFQGLQHDA